jgi:hypothetical protein
MQTDRIWRAQRAVVLQVLRQDHDPRWTRPELEAAISDMPQQAVVAALAYLAIEEVLGMDETTVWASKCARYMDTLDLVSI